MSNILNTNLFEGFSFTLTCARALHIAHEFYSNNIINKIINERVGDNDDDSEAYKALGKIKFISGKPNEIYLKTYKHIARTTDANDIRDYVLSNIDDLEKAASKAAYDDFEKNKKSQTPRLRKYLKGIIKDDSLVKDVLSTFDQYDPKEMYLIYLDRIELEEDGTYSLVVCPLWMQPGYEIYVPIQIK